MHLLAPALKPTLTLKCFPLPRLLKNGACRPQSHRDGIMALRHESLLLLQPLLVMLHIPPLSLSLLP
jgi:hypothetical protein